MKVFITGICGFLGSHLADALIAEGHEVSGNDNELCHTAGNYAGYIKADCCDYSAMAMHLGLFKPDVVVHCAATAHEGLSSFSPSFITKNIFEASVTTFSAAIAAGAKRIVYMTSMARYGEGAFNESNRTDFTYYTIEQGAPFKEYYDTAPVDPYGVAKVAAEDVLKILAKTHNIDYSILVPHNIIGTRQRYSDPYRNVASIMINRALKGLPLLVYGDGQQTRCFSPIEDCLPSIIKAVHGAADGEVVNIGPDKDEVTIAELARIINVLTGNKEIQHMPDRPNEVKHAFTSSDKARRLLGYKPQQDLVDCLREMIADIKLKGTREFDYSFPIEIEEGCPIVWKKRLV